MNTGRLRIAALLTVTLACTVVASGIPEEWRGVVLKSPRHFPHQQTETVSKWADEGERAIQADSVHSYDALHLDIHLFPDIESRILDARVTMSAVAVHDNLAEVDLHLRYATIDSVLSGETLLSYEHTVDLLLVELPERVAQGEEFAITVRYTVPFRSNNNYSGGIYHSSASDVLYTFGEPFGTRRWLACYDEPFDKVTSTMSVTLPDEYLVLSNGELTGQFEEGDYTRTVWSNVDPISTYLISIAASPYSVIEADPAGENATPIAFWVHPDDADNMVYDFGRTGEMLELFEGQFGVYPFNKYDQAVAPIFGGWGAMEHQTCTTFGSRLVGDGDRRFEAVVAHELAHQWWGNWVGPVDFRNIWLNEGFASYGEVLWAEHLSPELMRVTLQSFREYYFQEDNSYRFPIYDPPYDPDSGTNFLFSTTVYLKGGLILHMLRYVVGDEFFFEALQHYGTEHAYGSANTEELQDNFEEISGMDLTEFFDQWVYGQGYPSYRFHWFETVEDELLGNTVRLSIDQVQTNAPLFSTPIPLLLRTATQDTLVRVEMEALASQRITISGLEFLPTSYQFDPDRVILCSFTYLDVPPAPEQPSTFSLTQAWPNPFNASTTLTLSLSRPSVVVADVFDLLGRHVGNVVRDKLTAGEHTLAWQPDPGIGSGSYLIRFTINDAQIVRRVTLLK